jgi:aspartate aminotransferase
LADSGFAIQSKISNARCPKARFTLLLTCAVSLGKRFKTSADLADTFLREAHIVVTDGKPFGADGFLRFSYATSLENLQKAVEKIRKLLE